MRLATQDYNMRGKIDNNLDNKLEEDKMYMKRVDTPVLEALVGYICLNQKILL